MKRINIYLIIGALTIGSIAISCKKNEPGSLAFKMTAVENGNAGMKSSAGGLAVLPLAWDTAWIIVSKVGFEAEYEDHQVNEGEYQSFEVEYEWRGNQLVDLLDEPEIFATIELPSGVYDEIKLKVKSEEPSLPEDPNFYLSGLFASESGDLRITLVVSEDFEIKKEFEDWVIDAEEGSFFSGLLEISLQQLFSGISATDLANAEIVDGRILISEEVNSSLYEKIMDNFSTNLECDEDWDDDEGDDDHDEDEDEDEDDD